MTAPGTKVVRSRTRSGEPFVWLTGMGLATGLIMIVALLALIVVKGVDAFWPKRIVELRLVEGSTAGVEGKAVFGGEITKKQPRQAEQDPAAGKLLEWQLFVGNKDVYGLSFKFIDEDQIAQVSEPPGLMRLERQEYGPAFCYPVRLTLAGSENIDAADAQFDPRLSQLVDEVGDRWSQIKRIEKSQIGDINAQMDDLRIERRALESKTAGGRPESAGPARIDERMAALQKRYEGLAASVRELRAIQQRDTFTYRLITGEEKTIALGQVVDTVYPNRLGGWQRLGQFAHHLWTFVSDEPREANTEGGIFPAIFGTFVMTLIMCVLVTPFGVLAAIYLREYAKEGPFVRMVRIAINNLAGVPSIVFGVFGLGFFVYGVGGAVDGLLFKDRLEAGSPTFGTGGILWAALTLALMTVPVVIVASEEALAAVSRGVREGSLACGASKWQTIQRVVLPASAPGIITGMILAMARGAGEVAPLMLVGVVKLAPTLPLDGSWPFFHFDRKFMHLGFHIYDLGFQSPDSEAARPMVFATTMFLITLVVVMNLGAIIIRERLRRKYSAGAF